MLQTLLVGLGLGSLLWNAVAMVLLPLLGRERGLRIGRAAIARAYSWFFQAAGASGLLRMDAQALDPLADERGLIVVANHPSMLDAMMLVARLPRSACVMKASLARNPFLAAGARLARYIRNDSPHALVRLAVADLRGGGQLVLFPEGTRTTHWPVNRFHSAVGVIARRAGAPVQAVFIDTDSPYLGKGWPLWRLPPLPIVFSVRLGRRFAPPVGNAAAFQDELEAYFAAGVRPPRTTAAPAP
ncbi:MAG: 1-acyl-sn-glycerol-3-phosphate acyltransferase [Proteobacteria bacterium]|nr:1-acyl-sn-glycerol-3-phosphate acyltransferase [Pseudomonadota bacterium]